MKHIIVLALAAAMASFTAGCARCNATSCGVVGDAAVKAVNDSADVVFANLSSKKNSCDLLASIQSYYGANCKIEWK